MKTATTTQFRAAVRSACAILGYKCDSGWTDSPMLPVSATSTRYVSLSVWGPAPLYFSPKVAKAVVKKAESLLQKQGVTANTRTGTTRHYSVRGTCILG